MNKSAFFRVNRWRVVLLALAMMTSFSGQASTVMQMDFEEVTHTAELIFEGKVSSVESRQLQDGSIHTFVTLEVLDVLKGTYSDGDIQLSFLGGSVGDRSLEVADMQIPALGETGFYFVESLATVQVNPLVGWAQGHYLIETAADGSNVVTTASHEPIVTLETLPLNAPPATSAFSKGAAKGMVIQQSKALTQAMSVEDFKNSVIDIVAQAR